MKIPRPALAGIFVIAIIIGSIMLFEYELNQMRTKTGHYAYYYTVGISSGSNLTNFTLLLPAPSVGGFSPLGEDLVRDSPAHVADGWHLAMDYSSSMPMVRIGVSRLVPEYRPYPAAIQEHDALIPAQPTTGVPSLPARIKPIPLAITSVLGNSKEAPRAVIMIRAPDNTTSRNYTVINPGGGVLEPFEFGTSQKVAGPVNTMDPFSNEPLLSRGAPIQEINCRIPPYSKTSRCYQYSGPVYINYTSDEIPEIEISVSLSGRNEWWELVGWTSNEYSDRILLTLKNGEKGWIQATGNLQTGNGYYY